MLAHFPVALDCQMAKYVRSIFRDVRLARRQHQITDGGLTASPAHRRGQKMSMVKKGLAKIIRPVNISYHLKECRMAQALSKNTADATKV